MQPDSNQEATPNQIPLLISVVTCPLILGLVMFLYVKFEGAARKNERDPILEQARAQVSRVVTDLDTQTTSTGVYKKADPDQIQEKDPWGHPLKVDYAQGGFAETVTVRSAGPDGVYHSGDDVVASGMSANLKGVGEGLKQNAQETSSNVAKGLVKGTVDGVKESIRESLPSLPFRKKATEGKLAAPESTDTPAG